MIARVNHNLKTKLATTKDNSLRLVQTDKGLGFEIDLPSNALGASIKRMAEHGQLKGMSVAFAPAKKPSQIRRMSDNQKSDTAVPLTVNSDTVPDGSSMIIGRDKKTRRPFQIVSDADVTEVSVILPGKTPSYAGTTANLIRAVSDEHERLKMWCDYYAYS